MFFYTPNNKGLSNKAFLKLKDALKVGGHYKDSKEQIFKWLKEYLNLTTYEISCPAMRDNTLAPKGKSGLIISTLFEYDIVKHLQEIELYSYFKEFVEQEIPRVLCQGLLILIGLEDKIMTVFSSTPLSVESFTKNSEGAITGWSSTNRPLPAVSKLSKIASSINTPMDNISQCGHWTFSPGGLPIAILTGKLAADKVHNKLKKL